MHLIDEPGIHILPNDRNPSTKPNIFRFSFVPDDRDMQRNSIMATGSSIYCSFGTPPWPATAAVYQIGVIPEGQQVLVLAFRPGDVSHHRQCPRQVEPVDGVNLESRSHLIHVLYGGEFGNGLFIAK